MTKRKTIAKLQQQEIFDKVARHLLTQMEKSMLGTVCAYRGPRGLMCAIGPFIPDDRYSQDMEGFSIGSSIVCDAIGIELFSKESELLSDLQMIHDGSQPSEWMEYLSELAIRRDLSLKVLEEFK